MPFPELPHDGQSPWGDTFRTWATAIEDAVAWEAGLITADDTPAAPAEGESASFFVTSAVVWPAGLEWSTDPDGGTAPTITGTALVSLFTVGGVTYAVMGATFAAAPEDPEDNVPPNPGSLTATNVTNSQALLTISGAFDEGGLDAQPYSFSPDGGGTWSGWQASTSYLATGLAAGTAHQCVHRVRDAAGHVATGAPITVTTAAAATAPQWDATLTLGTPSNSGVTVTASSLATDDVAVTGYQVTYDDGVTWQSITPDGLVFTLLGTSGQTYSQTRLRAIDADENSSTELPVPTYTLTVYSGPDLTYIGLFLHTSGAPVTSIDISASEESAGRQVILIAQPSSMTSTGTMPTTATIGGSAAILDHHSTGDADTKWGRAAVFRGSAPTGSTVSVDVPPHGNTYYTVWTTDVEVEPVDSETNVGQTDQKSVTIDTAADGLVIASVRGSFNLTQSQAGVAPLVTRYAEASRTVGDGQTGGGPLTLSHTGTTVNITAVSYAAVA